MGSEDDNLKCFATIVFAHMGSEYGYFARFSCVFFVFVFVVGSETNILPARGVLLEDQLGSEVSDWFGSIGRSMQTLFTIQTLAGWVSWSISYNGPRDDRYKWGGKNL